MTKKLKNTTRDAKRDRAGRVSRAKRTGFTLVEMLVVLVIIAVLIAAVMGALRSARQMAWRTKARDTARQLVAAWNLHLIDYREFPKQSALRDPVTGGFAASSANLEKLNADKKIYLELSENERQDGLRDKWKRHFGFNLDFDYNGEIDNPAPEVYESKAKDYKVVRATAIAWSEGPDPKLKRKWIVQWQ